MGVGTGSLVKTFFCSYSPLSCEIILSELPWFVLVQELFLDGFSERLCWRIFLVGWENCVRRLLCWCCSTVHNLGLWTGSEEGLVHSKGTVAVTFEVGSKGAVMSRPPLWEVDFETWEILESVKPRVPTATPKIFKTSGTPWGKRIARQLVCVCVRAWLLQRAPLPNSNLLTTPLRPAKFLGFVYVIRKSLNVNLLRFWILHTYSPNLWEHWPSPFKGWCGKGLLKSKMEIKPVGLWLFFPTKPSCCFFSLAGRTVKCLVLCWVDLEVWVATG